MYYFCSQVSPSRVGTCRGSLMAMIVHDAHAEQQPTYNDRHWRRPRDHHQHHHETFLILSYNTLADANARTHSKDLSNHIPALIPNWEARRNALLRELQLWSPDVMCLQEVDRYHEFEPELQKAGYVGLYKKRTGTSRDDCATFWREEKFKLLEQESVVFHEYKLRDNVESRLGSGLKNRVVVGNVHVMFNPLRGDVKLGQARVLLERVQVMSQKWENTPVVVAGDFNSTRWSPLYEFLSSLYLDLVGLDRRCVSGQEGDGRGSHSIQEEVVSEPRARLGKKGKVQGWDQFELVAATGGRGLSEVRHKLKLRSVCSEVEGEPVVTTFHRMFKGTVDYIWRSEDLRAVRVLDTLPTSVLLRDKEIPSKRWATDHLALACELSFVPSD